MAAILLKDAPDGRIVTLNENGAPVEFILAAHEYESGLNGAGRTLLVRRKMIEYTQSNAFWAGHGEYYGEHEKCSWLNSTYKQRLDADMQAAAAQTKFYSTTGATHTQEDGFQFEVSAISRSVFELSAAELGATNLLYNTLEGTPLPTIQALYNPTVEGDDHDGKAIYQQTRTAVYTAWEDPDSIYSHVSVLCWYSQREAYPPQQGSPQYICIRPALTLPDSCYVLDDGRVVLDHAPEISGADGELGTFAADAPTVSYTVTDEDNEPVTVDISLDGETILHQAVTLGAENQYTAPEAVWRKVRNGTHTLTITASDRYVSTVRAYSFAKLLTHASVSLVTPMSAPEGIAATAMKIVGSVPQDAQVQILVSNNARDDAPVWEDATEDVLRGINHVFSNTKAVRGFAYNLKVTISRGESGQGGYLTSIGGAFE